MSRNSDLRGIKENHEVVRAKKPKRPKISGDGPLHVPQEIKDLNVGYFLYWAVTSDRNPYTLLELRRKGYEFVPASQLSAISDAFGDGTGLEQTYSDGQFICTGTGAGTKSYLMRIKQELKDEIDEAFKEEVLENQSRIDQDAMSNPGVYKKDI